MGIRLNTILNTLEIFKHHVSCQSIRRCKRRRPVYPRPARNLLLHQVFAEQIKKSPAFLSRKAGDFHLFGLFGVFRLSQRQLIVLYVQHDVLAAGNRTLQELFGHEVFNLRLDGPA